MTQSDRWYWAGSTLLTQDQYDNLPESYAGTEWIVLDSIDHLRVHVMDDAEFEEWQDEVR